MVKFLKKRRSSFFYWASGFLLLALGGLFLLQILFAEQFSWRMVGRGELADIRYDSRSSDPSESNVKEYVEKREAGQKEVQVQFDLKVYSFEERAAVFQTAAKNRGLRLELSKPSGIRLVVPYRNSDSTQTIPLAESLSTGEWVSVKITLDREKRLLVYLNQIQTADLTDSKINFDIANLTIGGAGKRSLELDGAIRKFQMEYRLIEEPFLLPALVSAGKILLISFLGILLALWVSGRIRSLDCGEKQSARAFYGGGIFLGCGALLVAVSIGYQDFWVYQTLQEGRHLHPLFDSRSLDPAISKGKTFEEFDLSGPKEIQVRFTMKAYSISGYSDVFQTAGGNSGIRMELAEPGRMSLVIGSKGLEGMREILITNSLQPNEWYAVRIDVDKHKKVQVYLNDILAYDHSHPSLNFSMSDLTLGTGFSKCRPFDGVVKDFRYDYRILRKRTILPVLVSLIQILYELAVLIYLIYFLKTKWKNAEEIKQAWLRTRPLISWKRWSAAPTTFRSALFWGVLSAGLLVLLSVLPEDFQFQTIRSERLRNISYDEGAEDPTLSGGKVFHEPLQSLFREVQAKLRIMPYSLAHSSRILQTASGDSGIRLEISNPSHLWLAFGSGGEEGSKKILVTDSLKVQEWSQVVFQIDRKRRLQVSFNGNPVVDLTDSSLKYQIADIAVGKGSPPFRPFEGAVNHFEMKYRLINKKHAIFSTILGIKILLTLAILPSIVLTSVRIWRRFGVWARISCRKVLGRPRERVGLSALGFLATAALALLLFLSFYGDHLLFSSSKAERVQLSLWEARSGNPGPGGEFWEYTETSPGRVYRLDLSFWVKVYSIQEFNNVFQTADGNEGLRMELHAPRFVALVFRDHSRDEVKGILLSNSLEFDRWHSVRMFRDPNERLKVYWDGDLVADISDARIGYKVSNIAVGTGFSRSRPLDGAIRDFTLEYQLRKERPQARGIILLLQCLSLLGLVGSLCRILIRILERQNLPEFLLRVRLFSILLLLGSAAQSLFFFFNHFHYSMSYPFNSPFFVPPDRFMDFFNINFRSVMETRYTEYSAICPPFGFLLARYFSLFADYGSGPFAARDQVGGLISLGIYLAIFFVSIGILCRRLARSLEEKGISPWPLNGWLFFLAVFLSYPVWNAVDRGNYIILGFTFFYCILYASAWKNQASSLCLASIISMKAHLGIYFIALADRLHWRKFLDTLFWLLFLNLIASVILQDFNFLLRIMENYGKFSTHFHPASKIFNSPSLFSVLYLLFHDRMSPAGFVSLERIYSALSLVGLILLAFYIRKKISDVNLRLFYLSLASILLPVASYDYNLILLLVFVPYLLGLSEGEFSRTEVALLALALIPKHYLTLYLEPYTTQMGETYLRLTEQILFTPLLLLTLLIIRLIRPALRASAGRTSWIRIRESFRRAVYPRKDQALEKSPGISSMNP